MNQIVLRFLSKIGYGLLTFTAVALTVVAIYFLMIDIGIEKGDAVVFATLAVIVSSMLILSVKMTWQDAKREVEQEAELIEKFLKGNE
jgi:hypothetical protein